MKHPQIPPSVALTIIVSAIALMPGGCAASGANMRPNTAPEPAPLPPDPSLDPTPQPTDAYERAAATPVPPGGAVIWKAGDPVLGRWILADTYQCGTPVQSGTVFTFDLRRDYEECARNQAQPMNDAGLLSTLTEGRTYTWTFHYMDGTAAGKPPGMGPDVEAQSLIWQLHDENGSGRGASLGFANAATHAQEWEFSLNGSYEWTGTYTPGEQDNWEIVVVVSNASNGNVRLFRNGVEVMVANGPNHAASSNPWWNFGPYKWRWELDDGGGSDMTTVNCTISNMLVTEL